jgi:hypothetical protein
MELRPDVNSASFDESLDALWHDGSPETALSCAAAYGDARSAGRSRNSSQPNRCAELVNVCAGDGGRRIFKGALR